MRTIFQILTRIQFQGKEILKRCLKLLPKTIVGQALVAKEADCEHKRLSALAMVWAAEARDRDKQLREMLIEDELAKYAISAAETSVLQKVLVGHSVEELEAATDFCVGAYGHNFRAFTVADLTLDQFENATTSQSGGEASGQTEDVSSDFEADS